MLFSPLLNQEVIRKRLSAEIYFSDPYADVTDLGLSFPKSYLKAKISNFSEGTGFLVLAGDQIEELQFHSNGYLISKRQFSTLDSIQSSGLLDEAQVGSLRLELTDEYGLERTDVMSTTLIPARISSQVISFGLEIFGPIKGISKIAYLPFDADVREKDILEFEGLEYSISRIHMPKDRFGLVHYKRCDLATTK